jgi:hypothetical protein
MDAQEMAAKRLPARCFTREGTDSIPCPLYVRNEFDFAD